MVINTKLLFHKENSKDYFLKNIFVPSGILEHIHLLWGSS